LFFGVCDGLRDDFFTPCPLTGPLHTHIGWIAESHKPGQV
jgi:hypothetical protein